MAKLIKVWDGTQWQDVATLAPNIPVASAQTSMPATALEGQLWLDTDGSVTDASYIPNTLTSATGDIIYASAANTPTRRAIGTTGQVLTVSGGVPTWATPASTFVGCSVHNNTVPQTIATNTLVTLTFSSESFDTDNFHSTTTNTDRITIPSGKSGKYLIIMRGWYDSTGGAAGSSQMRIYKNGTSQLTNNYVDVSAGNTVGNQTTAIADLVAGDYINVQVYQASGGNKNWYTYATEGQFSVQYLGA